MPESVESEPAMAESNRRGVESAGSRAPLCPNIPRALVAPARRVEEKFGLEWSVLHLHWIVSIAR